jgi:hypothetical protein
MKRESEMKEEKKNTKLKSNFKDAFGHFEIYEKLSKCCFPSKTIKPYDHGKKKKKTPHHQQQKLIRDDIEFYQRGIAWSRRTSLKVSIFIASHVKFQFLFSI